MVSEVILAIRIIDFLPLLGVDWKRPITHALEFSHASRIAPTPLALLRFHRSLPSVADLTPYVRLRIIVIFSIILSVKQKNGRIA